MLTNFLALALVTVIAAAPTQLATRATEVYKIHLKGDTKSCVGSPDLYSYDCNGSATQLPMVVLKSSTDGGEDGSPTQFCNARGFPSEPAIRLNVNQGGFMCLDLTDGIKPNTTNALQI
ncbi:hypothetical protein B0H13DRAFT_2334573 [Mycena leptocephala]|nr:hypothetical protein B0H13DRAFT_2334573 [Mycena leptocephala]